MWQADSDAFCQTLDASLPVLPPRSRLHSLEPVGAGTAYVEGQTGYTARLAEAQGVTVAALFGSEIGPQVDNAYLRRRLAGPNKSMVLASSFSHMVPALNGTGATARSWLAAMEALTMRPDLEQTTMLAWGGVLTQQRLIRARKAWCPDCYGKWRSEGKTVYEPLLWALQAVSSCAAHRRRLRTECGYCGRQLRHLASHSRPGYCSACRRWLGTSTEEVKRGHETLGDAEYEWQTWVSARVGEMLAAAPHLASKPSKEVIASSTVACVAQGASRGSILALSRAHNLPKVTVANWCRGDNIPRLESLLRLCFAVGVSPLDFLTGKVERPTKEAGETLFPRSGADIGRRSGQTHGRIDLDEVGRALKAALEEMPPPSMSELVRRLGRSSAGLKYRFPDLCRAIVARYKAHERRERGKIWAKARRALRSALKDESHPPVAEVARRIGWNYVRLSRRFPELCGEVSRRYARHLKSGWLEVGRVLEGILGEDPPPSMKEVMERLGRSAASLYSHLPRLCRRIAARHLEHRRKTFARRRKQYLFEVRRVALSLHREGLYPSVKKVAERLTVSKSLRSDRLALEGLRRLRLELKLDPQSLNPTSF